MRYTDTMEIEVSPEIEWTQLCLRLPKAMIKDIDRICSQYIGLNRSTWIRLALQSQIEEANEKRGMV